jgi:hypothetical protein
MKDSELFDWIVANPGLAQLNESSSRPGLAVAKYKRKVFYDDLWNRQLEECRGAVFDMESKKIVVLPFRKIYNYGIDPKSPKFADSTACVAYRKVNGFMLAVTLVEGAITLSTTGSLDSDFVGYGWDLIRKMDRSEYDNFALFLSRHPGMTHIFEAVHPDDPHIIPEVEGLYYLGSRYHNTESGIVNIAAADPGGSGFALAKSGIFVLQPEKTTVGALKEKAMKVDHEGFVFYTPTGAAKIKSPYYLAAKLFARAGNLDRLLNGKAKDYLDEELWPLVDAVKADRAFFATLGEQERLTYCREILNEIVATA